MTASRAATFNLHKPCRKGWWNKKFHEAFTRWVKWQIAAKMVNLSYD